MSKFWLVARLSPVVLFIALSPFAAAQTSQASSPKDAGDVLFAQGAFIEAIDAYNRAPADAATLNKIGVAWHHLSSVDEARKNYERALSLQPDFPEALSNLGSTYFVEKNYRQAQHLYERAFALNPKSAIIAANLGSVYFAQEKYEQGLEAYRTAFNLDPASLDFDLTRMIEGPSSRRIRLRRDYSLSEIFASENLDDRAIDFLRRAMGEGFHDWKRVMHDPAFAELRDTPQFAQLMLGS
ncbi:MAG TPA: tetratricopeptide repeat protein [Acidobacteriaceae bacterium]